MIFKLKSQSELTNEPSKIIMNNYNSWRNHLNDNNKGFFMLYNDFSKFLPELSTGALRLYLFYGFHSKNETGESWYSIDTIANKLKTSSRSINSWNKELEDFGLIYRSAENQSSKTTFLIPYSDYIIYPNQSYTEFISDYNKNHLISEFSGTISNAFHFYQWRKNAESKEFDASLNILVLVSEKKYSLSLGKEDIRKKYIVFNLTDSNDLNFKIEPQYIEEETPILNFDSPINLDFNIKGLVVNPRLNLKKHNVLSDLLNKLQQDVDYSYYQYIDKKHLKINTAQEVNHE